MMKQLIVAVLLAGRAACSAFEPLYEVDLGQPLGQCRVVPVQVGPDAPEALLLIYSADKYIDAFMGMFFFPKDTLKLALWEPGKGVRWERELHGGVIPGVWFNPALPFDLDQDGSEEIYMVLNQSAEYPLDIKQYKLEKIDARTGKTLNVLPWKGLDYADYTMSQRYRHYLAGGYADGKPVLVCIQGTYTTMTLQGLGSDGSEIWSRHIDKSDPGARGAHSCAVVDYDQDGSDEIFHGERCIHLTDGSELFVGDQYVWNGHSDVVAPFWSDEAGEWNLFTAREMPYVKVAPPRIVAFGADGRRRWTDLEEGHMDSGFVARIGPNGEQVAYALRLKKKHIGPDGFARTGEEFYWNPRTGERVEMNVSAAERIPVDINGDGFHELVSASSAATGAAILNGRGETVAELPADAFFSHASRLLPDRVGEQVVVYQPGGRVAIYGINRPSADDSPAAARRFVHPFYLRNRKLSAVGYNLTLTGGL